MPVYQCISVSVGDVSQKVLHKFGPRMNWVGFGEYCLVKNGSKQFFANTSRGFSARAVIFGIGRWTQGVIHQK